MAGSDYDVLVYAEYKADCHHLSELHILGFDCPQQRLRNSTPGGKGMALFVRKGFHSFWQCKLVFLPLILCFIFAVG